MSKRITRSTNSDQINEGIEENPSAIAEVNCRIDNLASELQETRADMHVSRSILDQLGSDFHDSRKETTLAFQQINAQLARITKIIQPLQDPGHTSQQSHDPDPRQQPHGFNGEQDRVPYREQDRVPYREQDRVQDRSFQPQSAAARENNIRKMDMPKFDGEDVYGWIAMVERYFRLHNFSDREKLEQVSISLSGDALSWFNYELNREEFLCWEEYKERMLDRFSNELDGDPSQKLFRIKMTGSMKEYVHEFEDLSSQITGLSDKKLKGVFMNGLTPAMREAVFVMRPQTLPQMVKAGFAMEKSMLKEVFEQQAKKSYSPFSKGSGYGSYGSHGGAFSSYNSGKPRVSEPTQQSTVSNSVQPQSQRPRINASPAELDEKKRKGLCFKCDGRYFRGHQKVCPNKELQLLQIVNGFAVEVLDENMCEAEDCPDSPHAEFMELSFNSYFGLHAPTTTKMRGRIGKHTVIVMMDSGATHNFMAPATMKRLKLSFSTTTAHQILLGTGLLVTSLGICKDVQFFLAGVEFRADFVALELGNADIILGVQWLSTLGKCELDWEKHEMSFIHHGQPLTLRGEPDLHSPDFSLEALSLTTPQQRKRWDLHQLFCTAAVVPSIAHPEHWAKLLSSWDHIFAIPQGLPPIRGYEHAINLVHGCTAVSVHNHQYPQAHKDIMERMVGEMLNSGIIRSSRSPFSCPALVVAKKDKSWRFCVDYRALNRKTIPDKYPIPIIDQLIDELYGASVFSKLDLRAGYHQIRMIDKDVEKTAFRTHDGHYEFLVMPFGLMNAPATFQALMNDLFRPYLRKFVLIFFDDILVFSSSYAEHEGHLKLVLEVFAKFQLYANRDKCLFGLAQVDYLGHIISAAGVSTDPAKTADMTAWPQPKTVKALRGFLGLTGYYRRFVQGYGMIARPLTELLKKDMFAWSNAAEEAFQILKKAMVTAPVLALPDFDQVFIVETDASGYGLGAVLMQQRRPIAYYSHGLTAAEQNKSIYERELMAIVLAVTKWKHYLIGRKFIVHTDQKSLKFLLEQREVSMEYQRWLVKLLAFDFDIVYKKGTDNVVADALSRVVHEPEVVTQSSLFALTLPSVLQVHDLYAELDSSPFLKNLLNQHSSGLLGPKFSLRQGRLWYKNRLLLPPTSRFIPLLLDLHHNSKLGGHSGVLKTIKRLQQIVHWSGMKTSVQQHVAACATCQAHKYSTLAPAGLLQPLPIPAAIWEDISMDFVEGLPTSKGKNVILVIVDRLSKYAHMLALRHPFNAADVAALFTAEIIRLHGIPASIVSDRDRIFQSNFWKECFRLGGTKLRYSTAFHPQTDGQTEVLNRTLETYLRCFASSHPRTWASFLCWAELWYNTSFHTSLKATPFKVVYGRDPPPIIRFEVGSTQNFDLELMLQERDLMLVSIKEHLARAQEVMKTSADKHRRDVHFSIDQRVYLKLRPYRQNSVAKRLYQKLAARYYGPFKVLERIGKVAYKLELPHGSKVHPVFHVSQLKAAIGADTVVLQLPRHLTERDELLLEPEQITNHKYASDGDLEVLVQWIGAPSHDRTWVKAKDLAAQFPSFKLEDKLLLIGRGIDMHQKVYNRKEKQGKDPSR